MRCIFTNIVDMIWIPIPLIEWWVFVHFHHVSFTWSAFWLSQYSWYVQCVMTELYSLVDGLILFPIAYCLDYPADAGTLVDSYISGKILQLKEQVATLEKREERWASNEFLLIFALLLIASGEEVETSDFLVFFDEDTRQFLLIESQSSEGPAVNFLGTR